MFDLILFKLFEFYGIENHPSKMLTHSLNDRHQKLTRKKTLMKVVTTPTISENEPFLFKNSTNR